jgi:uncharacterized membrane protein
MVFFHLFYDLTIYGYTQINFHLEPFWFYLPRFIVSLFLFAVGASLVITYGKKIDKKKFFHRQLKLVLLSLCVSLLTYFMFPDRWIYFGTLHCITVTSFVGILFVKRPKLSLLLAGIICVMVFVFQLDTQMLSILFPIKSMDFIPPYPWMAWVWIGIFFAHTKYLYLPIKTALDPKILFISRHSLIIYLIHQPILFYGIYLFSLLLKM